MDDVAQAARTIGKFLQTFTSAGELRLRFRVKLRSGKTAAEGNSGAEEPTEGASNEAPRSLYVEFIGPDTPLLTARNGEVLNALEHIATKILRLEPEAHDQVSFDADHFKANRDRQLRESAALAIERVRATGRPYPFPAMTSRERRMLHLILSESGLPTASSGEGPGRFVVLYPAGSDTSAPMETEPPVRRHDANRIRENFRHR
ncbi:MAG: R3H domain-containing nucleic acid-binding protein [Acidobacteriaceae bacterium]|jgi:spoIIIJ-associated protein